MERKICSKGNAMALLISREPMVERNVNYTDCHLQIYHEKSLLAQHYTTSPAFRRLVALETAISPNLSSLLEIDRLLRGE